MRAACANELGLEVAGHPQPASPLAPKEKAKGLDLNEPECNALVAYVRSLPTPVVIDPFGSQGTVEMRDGRRLFDEVGCVTCHVAALGDVRGIYSDLLLHNMGQTMSDSASSYGASPSDSPGLATAREWRTPPLWGYRDSAPYMHDGRASDLEEAVALHDGQGRTAAHRFFELSPKERTQVEAFLKSLVAPTAAAAPGIMLAAEMERRIEPDDKDEDSVPSRWQAGQAEWTAPRRAAMASRRTMAANPGGGQARPRANPNGRIAGEDGQNRGRPQILSRDRPPAAGTKEGRLAAERIATISASNNGPP